MMGKVIFNDKTELSVEIASTDEEKRLGLMHRKSLPEDQGMIFLYGENEPAGIWMKDTLINLDIIFIDGDNTIRTIAQGEPMSEKTIKAGYIPIKYVVETNKGFCEKNDIKEGDKIKFQKIQKKDIEEINDIANTLDEIGLTSEASMVDYLVKQAAYFGDEISTEGERPIAGDFWRHHMGKAHTQFIQNEAETRANSARNLVDQQIARKLEAAEADPVIADFVNRSNVLIYMAKGGKGFEALSQLRSFVQRVMFKDIQIKQERPEGVSETFVDLLGRDFNEFAAYIGLLTFIYGLEKGEVLLEPVSSAMNMLNPGANEAWMGIYKQFENDVRQSHASKVEDIKQRRRETGKETEVGMEEYRESKKEEMESEELFGEESWFEGTKDINEEIRNKSDEEKIAIAEKRFNEYLKDKHVEEFYSDMMDIIKNPYQNISTKARQNVAIWLRLGGSPFQYTTDEIIRALESFKKRVGTQPVSEDYERRLKKVREDLDKQYKGWGYTGIMPRSRGVEYEETPEGELVSTGTVKTIEDMIGEIKEFIYNKLQQLISGKGGMPKGFSSVDLAVDIAPKSTREVMEMLVAFAQLKDFAVKQLGDVDIKKESIDEILREYGKRKGLDYDKDEQRKSIISNFLNSAGRWRQKEKKRFEMEVEKKEKDVMKYWRSSLETDECGVSAAGQWCNTQTGDITSQKDLLGMLSDYKTRYPSDFDNLPDYLKRLIPAVKPVEKKKIKRDEKKSQVIFNLIKIADVLDGYSWHEDACKVDNIIRILRSLTTDDKKPSKQI